MQNDSKCRPRHPTRQRRQNFNFVGLQLLLLPVASVHSYSTTNTPSRPKKWFPRPDYVVERPRYQKEQHYDEQVTIPQSDQSIEELLTVQEEINEPVGDRIYMTSSNEILGASFATIVILGLASSTGAGDSSLNLPWWSSFAVQAAENVIEATMPVDSADVVAVILAESIGGIVGAVASFLLNFALQSQFSKRKQRNQMQKQDQNDEVAVQPIDAEPLVGEAVASSEYFVASSVSLPLLRATGISSSAAVVSSAILSIIPYRTVKLNLAKQALLQKEDEILDELLEENNRKEKNMDTFPFFGILRSAWSTPEQRVDPETLVPISEPEFDVVDLFSDVTRWLAYDVLNSDFQGRLLWGTGANMVTIDSSICSAIFGFLAGASSQFYADCLYGIFKLGPRSKIDEIESRSTDGWISKYASGCLSTTVLFGVYDFSQRPIGQWLQGMKTAGMGSCVGSDDLELCLQTYINMNPPETSSEAEFRTLVANLATAGQRIQDIFADAGSSHEVGNQLNAIFSSATVSAYSVFTHFLPYITMPMNGDQF